MRGQGKKNARDGLHIPECRGHNPEERGEVCVSGLVQPFGTFRSFAGVNVDGLFAVFALHGAAPLKLTLALGDAFYACGVITPPTTHDLAAVSPPGRLVTEPTGSTQ